MSDFEVKVSVLGFHPKYGELVSASAAKEVIAHFQSELAKANEQIDVLEKRLCETVPSRKNLLASLAKANERVAELERQVKGVAGLFNDAVDTCYELREARDKFAIEQKLEVLNELKKGWGMFVPVHKLQDKIEQLRKEQE